MYLWFINPSLNHYLLYLYWCLFFPSAFTMLPSTTNVKRWRLPWAEPYPEPCSQPTIPNLTSTTFRERVPRCTACVCFPMKSWLPMKKYILNYIEANLHVKYVWYVQLRYMFPRRAHRNKSFHGKMTPHTVKKWWQSLSSSRRPTSAPECQHPQWLQRKKPKQMPSYW